MRPFSINIYLKDLKSSFEKGMVKIFGPLGVHLPRANNMDSKWRLNELLFLDKVFAKVRLLQCKEESYKGRGDS